MARPADGEAYALALIALIFQALIAALLTLGTAAFLVVAPSLGGLDLGGGDSGGGSLPLQGHGFSPVDAVAGLLVALSLLCIVWTLLDYAEVVAPLRRGELLGAEAPALLLGLLQLVAGGILPGALLIAASRRIRSAIRARPALEVARSEPARPLALPGRPAARYLGRGAMIGFGVLWAVAGFSMFTNRFYTYLPTLITTASRGAPAFLSGWFHFWTYASSLGGPSAAYLAGALQLLLGGALLLGFARKTAIWAGLFGAVGLWVIPEAFGGPFAIGIFSLGPGIVYLAGMFGLVVLEATYGSDLATLDAVIGRHWPRWERVAEVSVGLVPAIGRWYVRNAPSLARAFECGLGAILAASAIVSWRFDLGHGLADLLSPTSSHGGALPWSGWWADVGRSNGLELAAFLIGAELVVAALLLMGVFRRFAAWAGLGLAGFLWVVVEGFGGAPGPGYTDPGVGIAEAVAFLTLLAVLTTGVLPASRWDRWLHRRASRAPLGPGLPAR